HPWLLSSRIGPARRRVTGLRTGILGPGIRRAPYHLWRGHAQKIRPVKNPFEHLDKALEHRARLQIMSVLVVNDSSDFNTLREMLGVTDGNLASHIKVLEKEKYLTVSKSFVDRKPNTRYKSSDKGKTSFRKHLDAME